MWKAKTKNNLAQVSLEKIEQLWTGIQDRVFWLTGEFRKLSSSVESLKDEVRLNRGGLNETAAAHNRLRFEFDHSRVGQNAPLAELKKDVFAVTESVTRTAELAAISVAQQAEQRKQFQILKDEVDRLRTLAAQRADLAVQKYNELEQKFHYALQGLNARLSKLEGGNADVQAGINRHNTILIEGLQKRVEYLEQPREIRLLVAAVSNPAGNLEPTRGINPSGNNACSPVSHS